MKGKNKNPLTTKAQMALEDLCDHAMVYEDDYDYDENPCGVYRFMEKHELEKLKKPIQHLIDNQLNEMEIIAIQSFVSNCLDYISVLSEANMLNEVSKKNIISLRGPILSATRKLDKQKSMYCR